MNLPHLFFRSPLLLVFSLGLQPFTTTMAQEVDFSCMNQTVLSKTPVTERLREFDVMLENDCPGAVNWTMCIERMDPFTNRVSETLTPSGQIEKDKKFRINLQMQKMEDRQNELSGYEEFYVNTVYAIDSALPPSCVARKCEADKKSVREKIRANERARQKAQAEVNRKTSRDCPKSGWSDSQQEKCMTQIQKDAKPELDSIAETGRELKIELAEIAPDQCEIHSAD
jgi:hypothetical protein